MQENPGMYHEARNRMREKQEQEQQVIEKKREDFEVSREKVQSRKKLDIFELKRRLETGRNLSLLKEDIRSALDEGLISIDAYRSALDAITSRESYGEPKGAEREKKLRLMRNPDFVYEPENIPFDSARLAQFFRDQKLGDNFLLDFGGFVYGIGQGGAFLLYIVGRICMDAVLLPRDIYHTLTKHAENLPHGSESDNNSR